MDHEVYAGQLPPEHQAQFRESRGGSNALEDAQREVPTLPHLEHREFIPTSP
jgi:hypothetical protein